MMRIECLISTEDLFRVIKSIGQKGGASLIFHRFRCEAGAPELRAVSYDDELSSVYNSGGYKLAYLSLAGLPRSSTDWEFLDRSAAALVEIAGGRQRKNDLELTTIRPVAKKSRASGLFASLKRLLTKECNKGVALNDEPYPNILWHPGAQELSFFTDVDTKAIKVKILGNGG